tara:strand:+ start:426 stop:1340 length:915 start_codon:yes stop_codon:yes gene_type:complete
MKLLSGPAIANHCDYDFGDQAGCLGGVPDAFMEDANNKNKNFMSMVKGREWMTLFIDNIRLYKRPITCNNYDDQMRVDHMMKRDNLLKLCKSLPDTKFIIFCSNEDTPITDDIKIPDNVRAIFAANAVGYSGKLYPFPYGVQRVLYKGDVRQKQLHIAMQEDSKPKKLLYINHSEHTNLSERGNIRELFSGKSYATVSERVSYIEYVNQIKEHKFMICPEGNAVDCHRNWEVLCLKRVPIMKRNPYLEEVYKDYPILWVDDYGKINKTLLAGHDDLFIRARNLDDNLLDLYSVMNRAIRFAKNS